MTRPLRVGSLVLRAFAVAVAAMCIAWGVAPSAGIASAVVGSVLGVVAGQLLGRSRLRLPVAVAASVLAGGAALLLAGMATGYETVPRALGIGATLRLALVLRFGAAAFAAVGALRAIATRRPPALVLELGAIAGSIAYVFAAHREGIISRPLWLSDWAWERGIDPVHVFLVLGGAAVVVLGLLLVAEAEERRGSAAAVLAIFAVLGVVLVLVVGPPKAEPDDRLGLTSPNPSGSASASAAPPPPSPPPSAQPDGGADGGGKPPPDAGDDGGGSKPQDQSPDGGSASPQGPSPDGGSSSNGNDGNADGGAPPPPPASEQLRDDDDSRPPQSPSPMAVVLLENDYSAPSEVYYFRQEAWSQWNGTKLVRASRADVDLDGADTFPSEQRAVRDVIAPDGRAKVRAQVALLVEHTRPFALETPVAFGPLRNPNPQRFQRAYWFESLALATKYKELRGKKAGNPAWSDDVRAYYTQTSDDARLTALARSIEAAMPPRNRGDAFATAVAVKLFLDDNYKYSTKEMHRGVPDPTADFLFGNKIGYCVHFAHAAVLLWRALGLPARVGTGYAVDESDRQGGSTILVRASNAHAWPEIYFEGVGWVVIDVTPRESLDDTPPPVDDELQRLLGEMARQMPPDPTKTETQPPVDPRAWLEPAGLFLGAMAVALLAMLYAAKLWRRAAPWWARPASLPRVGYRASLDLLAEAGFSRDRGESREAFAERVRARLPAFERLTAMHLAGQLGPRRGAVAADDESSGAGAFGDDLGERRRGEWSARLDALRGDLGNVPLWRRVLGWINPLSFLRSR